MLILILVAGLSLLLIGGDLFVRGSVSVARRFGISPLLIGLTLVGFGTSTPELVTSLQAAFAGSPGVAVGNVVGSNIANILLILGVAALIQPVIAAHGPFKRDAAVLTVSALAALFVVQSGMLDRLSGLIFVAGLLVYVGFAIWQERRVVPAGDVFTTEVTEKPQGGHILIDLLITAVGLGLTIGGASLLIDGAVSIAARLGISETIIGLTIVAIGTSLPELVTSLVAAIRKQGDVAFGNIVGSNIYNILGILGITAIVKPIPVPQEIAAVDIWVMLAATGALITFARTGGRINRLEGAILLAGYVGYTAWLTTQAV